METSPIRLEDLDVKRMKKGDTVFCAKCGAIQFLGTDMIVGSGTRFVCGITGCKNEKNEGE